MVVADNRAYDYSKRQYLDNIPLEQPQKQPETKPRKKPKTKSHIFSILFIFSMSILVISRYAFIAELGFNNRTLKEEYNNALKEKTDLNVQIMKTVNLDNLEQVAIEQLGMQYPIVGYQMVYVNVAVPASTEDTKGNQYHDKTEVGENKYITYVKGMIGSLMKLLD